MSRWNDLLAQGRDVTRAAVGYLLPLDGGERLEPMVLPHPTPAPRPPAGQAFRQVVRALGTERGSRQLEGGGRGLVARMMANTTESISYRELRSDQIARRRAAAGRAPAKPTRSRVWLFAGDQSPAAAGGAGAGSSLAERLGLRPSGGSGAAVRAGSSLAETLGIRPCAGCK